MRGTSGLCANAIDSDAQNRVVLLLTIEPIVYKLLCSLLSPGKLGDKLLAELVEALRGSLQP